jgi:hypothetical protein
MKFARILLAAAVFPLVFACWCRAENQAQKQSPAMTPFVTVVLRDFDQWDANHDGVLSIDEINKLVMDPAVKGEDAAALASLKLLSRNPKITLPDLTRAYFTEYNQKALAVFSHHATAQPADAIGATVDTVGSAATSQPAVRSARLSPDFDLYFNAGQQRIARGGPVRFTGRFVLEDTRQGPLGDCFFVASITSLAYHDPARFEKIITPQNDGSYLVNLPNANPITVPAPTDSELAISSTTTNDGTWLAILEQAFGKYKARQKGEDIADVEGTEIIRSGGDSMPTIRALTGHTSERFSFGKSVEYRNANAGKMLPRVREALLRGLADHRIMTAGGIIRPKPTDKPAAENAGTPTPIPPDILADHVYAILNYDKANDVVELWNPHGEHFEPKGPAGIQYGYPTEHGRFKLPLSEAYQFFGCFTIEGSSATAQR